MAGMGSGPWTRLGRFGWFISTWIVMMAAMMFPSAAPTVALYAKMSRQPSSSAFFLTGYLLTWTAAGVGAFLIGLLGPAVVGKGAWNANGRFFTAATLLAAALYEMSPLKHVCLSKCRSPIGLLLGGWRDGRPGALRMGMRNGTWCVGCCWALMASLCFRVHESPLDGGRRRPDLDREDTPLATSRSHRSHRRVSRAGRPRHRLTGGRHRFHHADVGVPYDTSLPERDDLGTAGRPAVPPATLRRLP